MVYYNQDNILVRTSEKKDIDNFKDSIRSCDVREVWDSHHMKPTEAVKRCIEETIFSLTVEDSGKPVAIFGINPENILGDSAIVWMLATDNIDNLRNRFARNSRRFINLMLDYYPNLENYVSVENEKSIEWLKFCGAKFEEPKTYGLEGKLFMRFTFTKNQKRRF